MSTTSSGGPPRASTADATTHQVTDLLRAWSAGDAEAPSELWPLVYGELHRLARSRMACERRDHTLEPTALVHEVYVRLAGQRSVDWRERGQFFALASQAMRRILVDHARQQRAGHRVGAGDRVPLTAAGEPVAPTEAAGRSADWLDVDRALARLERLDPRQARLVELRFFAGLTVREAAELLEISTPTAVRDWRMAKAWLHRQLANDVR